MARRVDVVLAEILETIERLQAATAGKSIEDFKQEWVLKLAVQRALEIISEASRHIPDELLAHAPNIAWAQIKGVGNILRHEYHRIADEIIWAVIVDHLPPLKEAIEMLAENLRATDKSS